MTANLDHPHLGPPRGERPGSADRELRLLRDRQDALARASDLAQGSNRPFTTARQLVQIYDGGAMPSAPGLVYFSHPVQVTGGEAEGGSGALAADAATTIPVIVLGHAPSVGDLLTAYGVGGRWVAEKRVAAGSPTVTCLPCSLPKHDLVLSWVNILSGNGSTTLTYTSGPDRWSTGCVLGQKYALSCTDGNINLVVTYFLSGTCPTGQAATCATNRADPNGMPLTSHTCAPLSLTFTVAPSCPEVEAPGYTSFTITDPGNTAIRKPGMMVAARTAGRRPPAGSVQQGL